jgi:hypothetical protein
MAAIVRVSTVEGATTVETIAAVYTAACIRTAATGKTAASAAGRKTMTKALRPIHRSAEDLSNCSVFFHRVGPKAEKLIRRLQPHEAGAGDVTTTFYRLKEGDIILRSEAATGLSHQGETHAQFAFEAAFGEGQVGDGEPLMPNLKLLINFTERVVDIFHRHIFRHA